MRKKTLLGIIGFVVTLAIVMTIFPTELDAPPENGNIQQLDAQNGNKKTVQPDESKFVNINSIRQGNKLVEKLNNSESVITINHSSKAQSHYIDHQVSVKFKEHPDKRKIARIETAISGRLIKRLDHTYVFESKSKAAKELVKFFNHRDNVVFAEPNYIYLQNQAPNDALYQKYQWNLPTIKAEDGWDISQGSENVQIAVIDTGVDLDHPDLADRVTEGYNVLAENNSPNDDNGHGTHVAGIIASETNNRQGIAGITWFSQIMPVKVMNSEGAGTAFDVAKGIRWATNHGADVINLSLGNYQSSDVLREAVGYAVEKDVILVAASGNDNTNQIGYPASYQGVLAVSAVNKTRQRANFSNYGKYVDVTAPGVNIASTYKGGKYAALSGTSMAAPHVTALAGLIRSLYPDLENNEVIDTIKTTAVDLGEPGKDNYYGAGLINIEEALQATNNEAEPFGGFNQWLNNFTDNN